jgi:large subunit ribosomal protein L32
MAVPKKRTSVSRKGLRRAGQHHKLYRKHPMSCPNCGELALPHTVCSACGVYKGKEIIEIKAETDDAEGEAQA